MRRFFDKNLPICTSYDAGKLMFRVMAKNWEEDAWKALEELAALETELKDDEVKFETTKRNYIPAGDFCGREKTDAIIIDLALPGAFRKITGILGAPKPKPGS